jgi:hypothetical protein
LDLSHLTTILKATAAVTALMTAFGLLMDPVWGSRYAVIGTLALVNWFALSKAISGLMTRNVIDLGIGLLIKPFLVVLVLIAGKMGMIEVTSFLLGVNTFFLTLFGYMAWRAFAPTNRLESAGSPTNG